MAKIAAIIMPVGRASRLPEWGSRLGQSLCLYAGHRLETQTYRGTQAVCMLLRVAPDPLSPEPQPSDQAGMAGVACGYYLSADSGATGGSAQRLVGDMASGGTNVLPRADGVYAFACWDKRRECLITGVDKLGMRPLYWLMLPGGGYAVASEIKALAGLAESLETNWAAWEEHLTFGFVFGEHTFLKGIQRLGVAQAITFRHDRHVCETTERFLETIAIVDRPQAAFLEEQGAVFDDAMTKLAGLYDAPRDTMLTLSGGFDSRRALAWLLQHGIRPRAYTVPDVGLDGCEFESAIVRELCRAAGLESYKVYPRTAAEFNRVRYVRDLATDFESDEHGFSAILAMGLNCHDRVNFDGLAAGSQLSGSFVTGEYFEPGGQERFIASLTHSDWVRRMWLRLPEYDAPPLEDRLRAELETWGDNPNRFAYFYLLSRTRREIALAPLSIQASVFESLCPYLDRGMMRSALSYPPMKKIGANIQMRLIEALHPKLSQIPTTHSPGVADNIRYRVEMGKVERGARRELLREVSWLGSAKVSSGSMKQRFRFRAAAIIAAMGHHPRLRWEIGKAAKIGQLAHFEKVSQSPAHYRSAVAALETVLGQRTDWCQPL